MNSTPALLERGPERRKVLGFRLSPAPLKIIDDEDGHDRCGCELRHGHVDEPTRGAALGGESPACSRLAEVLASCSHLFRLSACRACVPRQALLALGGTDGLGATMSFHGRFSIGLYASARLSLLGARYRLAARFSRCIAARRFVASSGS